MKERDEETKKLNKDREKRERESLTWQILLLQYPFLICLIYRLKSNH
jgi:hypothetical protein